MQDLPAKTNISNTVLLEAPVSPYVVVSALGDHPPYTISNTNLQIQMAGDVVPRVNAISTRPELFPGRYFASVNNFISSRQIFVHISSLLICAIFTYLTEYL